MKRRNRSIFRRSMR